MILGEITTTDVLLNILQFVIPSLVVFAVAYGLMKTLFEQQYKSKALELKNKRSDLLTPNKLQAYERLTLFLDRITPDQLVMRHASANMSATQFKLELQKAVNEEFAHNVSQQIYISSQAWTLIKAVKEQVLGMIEACYKDMNEKSTATDLGKAIIQEMIDRNDTSTRQAIQFLKKELDIVF